MSRRISILLLTILAVGVVIAQHWEFEQVDTAPWGRSLQLLRHPDGRLFMAYGDDSGYVRIAWRDSFWHREQVPLACRVRWSVQSLAIGPHGEVGIGYLGEDTARCALRTDTGWVHLRPPADGVSDECRMAFDTSGAPVMMFDQGGWYAALACAEFVRDTWVVDTVLGHSPYSTYFSGLELHVADDGRIWGMHRVLLSVPGEDFYGDHLFQFSREDTGWCNYQCVGGYMAHVIDFDGTLDTAGTIQWCTYWGCENAPGTGFVFSGEVLDCSTRTALALCVDCLDRPLIANMRPETLLFWFRDSTGWWKQTVGRLPVRELDMVLNDSGQPIIAYSGDSGVWIAYGVDVVGTGERQQPAVRRVDCSTTICRGMLMLPDRRDAGLLDITGRKVMDLQPGENDIRHLAPGVYFVREEGPRGQGSQGPSVRKIVIQK